MLRIWSCGTEQGEFRTVTSAYYRSASIVIFAFSTRYRDIYTFDSFNNALHDASENARRAVPEGNVPLIMCGINYSENDSEKLEWSEQDKEDAKKKCQEKDLELMWLDCTRDSSINQLMKRIVRHIVEIG